MTWRSSVAQGSAVIKTFQVSYTKFNFGIHLAGDIKTCGYYNNPPTTEPKYRKNLLAELAKCRSMHVLANDARSLGNIIKMSPALEHCKIEHSRHL